jgi:uncharacterized Zn finger protein (UPF0148 family)
LELNLKEGEMKCPVCENDKELEFTISPAKHDSDFAEAELYCPICDEVVAFYQIHDDDWIPTA